MDNIYNAIQNVYNMDKTTWQEVLAELYNLVANVENKFDLFELKFGSLLGEQVIKELKKMYDDGSLASLINDVLLQDINEKVDTFKTEVSEQLEHNTNKIAGSTNVMLFGAKTENTTSDTNAFINAIETELVVNVPEGVYKLNKPLQLKPYQSLILNKRAIIYFTITDEYDYLIKLGYNSSIEGYGQIKVESEFSGDVVLYDTDYAYQLNDKALPFTCYRADVMTKTQCFLRDFTIIKTKTRPDTINDVKGVAIRLIANNTKNASFIWGALLDNIKIVGGFDNAIKIEKADITTDVRPWLHDTTINNVFVHYAKNCFNFKNVSLVKITNGAYQPQLAIDGAMYCESTLVLDNCSNITLRDFSSWDSQHSLNQPFILKGECNNITIYDIAKSTSRNEKRRVYYDNFKSLLTLKYYTADGEYIFEEVTSYKSTRDGSDDFLTNFLKIGVEKANIDYAIPINPHFNISSATNENPIYLQIGTYELPRNAEYAVYNFAIQESDYHNNVSGYSVLHFKTDANGNCTMRRRLNLLNNVNPDRIPLYGFEEEIQDDITIVTVYRVYISSKQDSYQYQRYLRIINPYLFKTKIKVNPTVVSVTLCEEFNDTNIVDEKPSNVYVGYTYFNSSLGKPIWCKSVNPVVWVDSQGNIIS